MDGLKDKVVILTGAAGGVGQATAEKFAKEGVRLVLTDLQLDPLTDLKTRLIEYPSEIMAVQADISSEASVDNLIHKTLETYGRIDILVNNAGFSGSEKCLAEDYDMDMARKVFDVNTLGTFYCMKKVLPIMRAQGSGVIVNTTSVAADRATPYQAIYAASKAAIVAMTKAIAWEYGSYGLRVIAIGPSAIDTPMIDAFANGNAEEVKKQRAASNALGRIARPEKIANLIVFLSSEEASFMTGVNVLIDGGNRK